MYLNPCHEENLQKIQDKEKSASRIVIEKLHKVYEKFYVNEELFHPNALAKFSDD